MSIGLGPFQTFLSSEVRPRFYTDLHLMSYISTDSMSLHLWRISSGDDVVSNITAAFKKDG